MKLVDAGWGYGGFVQRCVYPGIQVIDIKAICLLRMDFDQFVEDVIVKNRNYLRKEVVHFSIVIYGFESYKLGENERVKQISILLAVPECVVWISRFVHQQLCPVETTWFSFGAELFVFITH